MAKDDDEILKRYAAETRGMPPNLARIAARNLAAQDKSIGTVNAVRSKVDRLRYAREDPSGFAQSEMDRGSAAVQRFTDFGGGVLQGKETGYYDAKGKYLGPLGGAMPKGATGIVGAAKDTPTTDPNTSRLIGYYGPSVLALKPEAKRTPWERSLLAGFSGMREGGSVIDPSRPTFSEMVLPTLGRFAARGGFALPGFGGAAFSAAQSFFPAIRSLFNSRPRPYNPAPLRGVGAPSPSPTASPSSNPYYADADAM